jgi:sugar phosphate isomerase/epimerase
MKVGVFTVLLGDKPLEEALDIVKNLGAQAVELGCGAYPGNKHCNPDELLADDKKCAKLLDALKSRGLIISCLSCHGNPLHPDKKFAAAHDEAFQKTVKLAKKLGVDRVTTFSGCPGDHENAKWPNWVTCAWPTDYLEVLKWQWEKVVVPYWKKTAEFTQEQGVRMICFEMHPGFVVYNPETLQKLRDAVGPVIGANFDPSHLFWQGIDPCVAVRELKGAIFHVHAKDTALNAQNIAKNGVLDTKPYTDELNRSWIFRTVGYGHGTEFWNNFVSSLRMVGYDYVLSIEHEDSLMSQSEGLRKAVEFLNSCILREGRGTVYWT